MRDSLESEVHSRSPESVEVQGLLLRLRDGDRAAESRLLELLYSDLRRLAARFIAGEAKNASLSPTGLVNEMYVRLIGGRTLEANDRKHFLALSCRVMRRLLVDRARARKRLRRSGGDPISFTDVMAAQESDSDEIILVDQALGRLAAFAPRAAKIVELRYFGGLADAEIAAVLDTSVRTVLRDWSMAKAWLLEELASLP